MDRNVDRPGGRRSTACGAHDGHRESAALEAEKAEPRARAGSTDPGAEKSKAKASAPGCIGTGRS